MIHRRCEKQYSKKFSFMEGVYEICSDETMECKNCPLWVLDLDECAVADRPPSQWDVTDIKDRLNYWEVIQTMKSERERAQNRQIKPVKDR